MSARKRIVDEKSVSLAEYHFTVEFLNQDGSLFVRGPVVVAMPQISLQNRSLLTPL